jgi:phosphate transport system permease protein
MTVPADKSEVMEPADHKARPVIASSRTGRRLLVDRLARRTVTLGGIAIIVSILAIFFVIAAEAFPLFRAPSVSSRLTFSAAVDAPAITLGVDEYREQVYVVTKSGIHFRTVQDGGAIEVAGAPELSGGSILGTIARSAGGIEAVALSDGRIIPVRVMFAVSYPASGRVVTPDLLVGTPIQVANETEQIRTFAYVSAPDGPIAIAAVDSNRLVLVSIRERRALIGETRREETRRELTLPIDGHVSALLLDGRGEDIYVGTSHGQLLRVDIRDPAEPRVGSPVSATSQPLTEVTAMTLLLGDRTVLVADAQGRISSWQLLMGESGDWELTRIYEFAPCRGRVVSLAASSRDKGFVAADSAGAIHLYYGTTGSELLTIDAGVGDLRAAALAPKGDGIFALSESGEVAHWALSNPHPEINLRSLFGKVWYEGYRAPEYVWQSTGGTDDFEAKFSLMPLVFGTLKGTFYALILAVPISLLAAIYASQFMHPDIKRYVKPTVEIMAALPSVVLGFIAGLWLAPIMESIVPGIFLLPIAIPFFILLALLLWQVAPRRLRSRLRPGTEVFLLVPVVVGGSLLAFQIGSLVERSILEGDYRNWLLSAWGITYDQRNSLVVGFAMGFAVIPIIFTIAEDSLSNVPQHLTAGSLALGATRWQTATRVVLPTASPGIFSAVMIGFGRAVGETMIVLMATGNTPVLDWSMFNGFRALSANIAVELPEAPEGGTLYRVLFLAALLLFVITFFVNTLAELVRLRLRRKYRYL